MRFVVSSTELLSHLQAVSRVISSKSTLPILDNFLFKLDENELTITASDLESTMITKMELQNVEGEGSIAIEAKRLTEILKEFPEQPLSFNINMENLAVDIITENGKYSIVGQLGEEFPQSPELEETETNSIKLASSIVLSGITKTIFATAEDELRPVMNGILMNFGQNSATFVATDAHKLVKYRRTDVENETECLFILPKKPATLLKNLLSKEDAEITIQFDEKNAIFSLSKYKLISRLIEGEYPNYESVIPTANPHKLTIDRIDFQTTLRRVSVFSNHASNLIKLELTGNQVTISAQDIDFSISAYEHLNCQYEGEEMEIGFKSTFLVEMLQNISSQEVVFEMADPSQAGIIVPLQKDNENEDELMLLMPMMIGS